ncbi:hypothetical protein [Microcystis phage Mwe-JY25]
MPLILSMSHGQTVDIGDLGSIKVRFDLTRRRVQLEVAGDGLSPCKVRRDPPAGEQPNGNGGAGVEPAPPLQYNPHDPSA